MINRVELTGERMDRVTAVERIFIESVVLKVFD